MIQMKILKWDKYNKRNKDVKRPFWFCMSNAFFLDPSMADFDDKEKLTFIYLLCEASRQNKYGELEVSEMLFERITGYKKTVLSSTIDKLLIIKAAAVFSKNVTATQQDKTLHNKTEESLVAIAPVYDFDQVYKKYPRKLGKAKAIATLKKCIKSEEEMGQLERAVLSYATDCAKKGTEERFIKHFDSFVGTVEKQNWRDWIDYNFEKPSGPSLEEKYSFLKD